MAKITLGSNIGAQRTTTNLERITKRVESSYARLASGMRINKASDDAAGLAIAEKLKTKTHLYDRANLNINDGISTLNIAESGISQQSNILTRLAELAEQSANGVYSNSQRVALDEEYQALVREFGRIADTTEFNGLNLLLSGRGSNAQDITLQAGVDGSTLSTLTVTLDDTGTFSGQIGTRNDADGSGGVDGADTATLNGLINGSESITDSFHDAVNGNIFRYKLEDSDGASRNIAVAVLDDGTNRGLFAYYQQTTDGTYANAASNIAVGSLADEHTLNLTFGDTGATANLDLDLRGLEVTDSVSAEDDSTTSIEFTGVDTATRARHALGVIKRRGDELNNEAGKIGAAISRLETATQIAEVQEETNYGAESRIRDADYAEESAKLSLLSISQNAATAVLAQANQTPALSVQLLQG